MPEPEPHTPSPRSLIITFYGAYGREFGEDGTVPIAVLIRLLGAVGVDAPSVRSAVSRLKRRGLLVPGHAARTGGGGAGRAVAAASRTGNASARSAAYAPSEAAWQLLRDGDRRIYDRPHPDDDWLLAVFSVPESERRQRHVLRSRLSRLGFGNAAPGVWIAPAQLEEETRHTLSRLELTRYVDLFRGVHAGFEPTASGVARWWDLPAIAALHRDFLAAQEPVLRSWARRREVPARDACRDYLLALDAWRRLPYADPGLPARLLPADWPGERAAEVFAQLHRRLRDAGADYPARLWEET